MSVQEITDGNDDGSRMGQSTSDKIAFFGDTPIVQPTGAAAATAPASTAAGSLGFGFSTSQEVTELRATVNTMAGVLQNLGLMSTP